MKPSDYAKWAVKRFSENVYAECEASSNINLYGTNDPKEIEIFQLRDSVKSLNKQVAELTSEVLDLYRENKQLTAELEE